MEGYLGEIRLFGPNWAPRSWALCHGQLLPIAQNQSLFSILGTTYGGDGRTSFALPDLRGRTAIHEGSNPYSGNSYRLGQKGGAENVILSVAEIPAHNHDPQATTNQGDDAEPTGRYPGEYPNGTFASSHNVTMGNTANTGGGQGHENMQPWLGLSYIICISGLFPSRS